MKQTNNKREIFATGVFLESVECIINGKKQWRWVAVNFEDDSFLNGKVINPIEHASKREKLLKTFKD